MLRVAGEVIFAVSVALFLALDVAGALPNLPWQVFALIAFLVFLSLVYWRVFECRKILDYRSKYERGDALVSRYIEKFDTMLNRELERAANDTVRLNDLVQAAEKATANAYKALKSHNSDWAEYFAIQDVFHNLPASPRILDHYLNVVIRRLRDLKDQNDRLLQASGH